MSFIRKESFRDPDIAEFLGMVEMGSNSDSDWDQLREKFLNDLREEVDRPTPAQIPEPLHRNLQIFGDRFGLKVLHQKILLFSILRNQEPIICDAVNAISSPQKNSLLGAIARCASVSNEDVHSALEANSPLLSSGVFNITKRGLGHLNIEIPNDRLIERLFSRDFNVDEALAEIAQPLPEPTLKLTDFNHLRIQCRRIREYLSIALREKRSGVNILLYGPPGTGKSELSSVLAKSLRTRGTQVSAIHEDGTPLAPGRRLEKLHSAQHLLKGMRIFLVFDECEDVFRGESFLSRGEANQRKAWMNRMLENNPVPTIWISNSVRAIDQAFLRRFDLSVEMGTLPKAKRIPVYKKICGNKVSADMIRVLAEEEMVTPAIVSRAVDVAHCIRKENTRTNLDDEVKDLVSSSLKAQNHSTGKLKHRQMIDSVPFSTRWINSDPDLSEIRGQLSETSVGCRLCLYGPPGTGKTAFGRWLARSLGKELRVKRTSDILSPFLGETEAKLARAFEEASSTDAVLMIDEIDSLLRNRREAVRSWEVTQVNEFLTQMEGFDGILICSTNDWESLDPACLRRFDLKAKLDYLRPSQTRKLGQVFLKSLGINGGGSRANALFDELENATPGDFAVCARRHQFHPFQDATAFAAAIQKECSLKPSNRGRSMGFLDKRTSR